MTDLEYCQIECPGCHKTILVVQETGKPTENQHFECGARFTVDDKPEDQLSDGDD